MGCRPVQTMFKIVIYIDLFHYTIDLCQNVQVYNIEGEALIDTYILCY